MIKTILSIDPSIRNIGFSLIQITDRKDIDIFVEETYYPRELDDLISICDSTYDNICRYIGVHSIDYLVMEYPMFMGGNAGTNAAVKGYTLDLAAVCGFLAGRFGLGKFKTYIYTPMQWKNNRPKTATQAAYKRLFPFCKMNSEHSCDAVMLGVFFAKKSGLLQHCN